MDTLKELDKFNGKRNTVMTFLIPPHTEFHKNLGGIMRTILAIKHTNKRGQSKSVLAYIIKHTEEFKKLDGNGAIICAGIDNSNSIFYRYIPAPSLITSFEYYYDYVFNMNRIKEIFFDGNVVRLDDSKQSYYRNTIIKRINSSDPLIILGNEIHKSLDLNMVQEIYYFSSESIPYETLERVVEYNIKINCFDMDNIHNKDMFKKYGIMIGTLRYASE